MKTLRTFIYLLFLLPLLGCEELEELLEEEFDVDFSITVPLTVESPQLSNPDEAVSFSSDPEGYNFATDSNITQYISDSDEIKKIEITSVRYEYTNFGGNVDVDVTGDVRLGTGLMSAQAFSTPSVNVAQADLLGDLFTLSGDFSQVNSWMSESNIVTAYYTGNGTHNPFDFVLLVTFNVKATIAVEVDNF